MLNILVSQHRLDLCSLLKASTGLRSHLVDCDAVRELDQGQALCEVNIEHTL